MSSQIIDKISENEPLTQVIPAPFIPFISLSNSIHSSQVFYNSSNGNPKRKPPHDIRVNALSPGYGKRFFYTFPRHWPVSVASTVSRSN